MAQKETNFKQTDIGLIPHDWEVATIGDGFKFITNNTLSRGQLTNKGSVLNVHYGDVHVRFSEVLDLEKSTLPFINTGIRRNAKPYLIDGDIVMADTAEDETVGKSCEIQNIGEWKVEAGLHTFAMRPTQRYASRFLGYFINSKSFHSQLLPLIQGTKVYSVTKGDLKGTAVLKPPIEEQKRIAEVLSHFDEHIDNLVALLEKRRQVKAATMQALLSGTTRLPDFTLPWEEMMLGDLCEFRTGYTPSKSVRTFWENGTIPWFRMDDIRENGRKLLRAKQYVTEEAVKGGGLFEAGSFILATTATIGEHAWLIADSIANQQFTNLKIRKSLKNTLSAHFFFYYLYIIDEYCKRNTKTGTFAAVDIYDLKAFKVPTPPLKEQEAIASVLSNMDRGIEALEQEIKKYRQMKEGAMEELLTGKVRLI